jgi:hypothetical protein
MSMLSSYPSFYWALMLRGGRVEKKQPRKTKKKPAAREPEARTTKTKTKKQTFVRLWPGETIPALLLTHSRTEPTKTKVPKFCSAQDGILTPHSVRGAHPPPHKLAQMMKKKQKESSRHTQCIPSAFSQRVSTKMLTASLGSACIGLCGGGH